ncbi:hypothetical protein CY658_05590 [Variovorax sp. RO1]|nr:hypothetical protein CY658_05590 [Variovorax sp. RO1]
MPSGAMGAFMRSGSSTTAERSSWSSTVRGTGTTTSGCESRARTSCGVSTWMACGRGTICSAAQAASITWRTAKCAGGSTQRESARSRSRRRLRCAAG